jgi:hypothetical protein
MGEPLWTALDGYGHCAATGRQDFLQAIQKLPNWSLLLL